MRDRARGAALLSMIFSCLLCGALARGAEVTQKGNLRVSAAGKIAPQSLPRSGAAPIAVSVSGQVSTTDHSLPPQLRTLRIEVNRHGHLDYHGLPVCGLHQIQPATNPRALSACRSALVGEGTFSAYIVLKGQEPYATSGRLLVFNGREHGHQVLLGHIYIAKPFASSFVIVFQIAADPHGRYGTVLTASLAKTLGARRYLTGIEMTLQRRYSFQGTRHSYLSSGCPAPKGFGSAVFPLLRASFSFVGGKSLTSSVIGSCRVRG